MNIEGQGYFLPLAQGHLYFKIKTCFSQKSLCHFNQILYVSLYMEMEIYLYDAGHITKMAAMPIYGKIPLRIFFPGINEMISIKFGM